jgi:hypothetical protein
VGKQAVQIYCGEASPTCPLWRIGHIEYPLARSRDIAAAVKAKHGVTMLMRSVSLLMSELKNAKIIVRQVALNERKKAQGLRNLEIL